MDSILDFLANNYIWFGVVSIALLFSIFGMIATGRKKKSTTETVDSQPIAIDKISDENTEIKQDSQTLVIEETKSTQPVFEPSLDGFTSNVTDVKVAGIEAPVDGEEESSMLILDDTKPEMGETLNDNISQNEENQNEPQMLVLDDAKPELGVQTQGNNTEVINSTPEMQTNEPNILVLNDTTNSTSTVSENVQNNTNNINM